MPCLRETQFERLGGIAKPRPNALKILGEARTDHQRFDDSQDLRSLADHLRLRANLAGHGEEDAMDLRLFLFKEPHQFVVLLDCFQWLDIYSLPAGTCAVHNSGNTAFRLGLDRNHEALAANRD